MKRIACLLAVAALFGAACGSTQESEPERAPAAARPERTPSPGDASKPKGGKTPRPEAPVEDPAPAFAFETFEGETFRLSEHRGTPIVLNFWESW
jgi:hypothetical protein